MDAREHGALRRGIADDDRDLIAEAVAAPEDGELALAGALQRNEGAGDDFERFGFTVAKLNDVLRLDGKDRQALQIGRAHLRDNHGRQEERKIGQSERGQAGLVRRGQNGTIDAGAVSPAAGFVTDIGLNGFERERIEPDGSSRFLPCRRRPHLFAWND